MPTVRARRGFTLVEVLVVLVITSLVSALLFQALAQIYRVQGRFGDQLAQSQGGAMRADWYRQLLQGLRPDYADGNQKFVGLPDRLAGLTATAPRAAGGAAEWIELKLVPSPTAARGGDVRLIAATGETVLLTWTAQGRAQFSYLDDNGAEHEQWPPLLRASVLADEASKSPQIPAAILLKLPGDAGQQVIVSVPRGERADRVRRVFGGNTP